MSRMKTFATYLLLFIGLYVISNILISAYIKTSYHTIKSYEISDEELTVTIITAKSSKDDGYIEGKISNGTEAKVTNKYMKVELYSESNVNLGEEYVKVEEINPGDIKNFKVSFTCDNVKHFKITFLSQEEKDEIDANKDESILPDFGIDENVSNIVDSIDPKKNN